MEITALGMIETSGLLSAIEAADAGLKAANVRLLGTDYVRGGLVMVRFEGDVAAVQAAVDAGAMAAQRVGVLISAHVIPRAMPEVFCMLASDPGVGPNKRSQGGCASCGGCEGGMRELRGCMAKKEKPPEAPAEKKPAEPVHADKSPDLKTLSGWKVVQLRSYARKLPNFPLTANEIRYANKARLLEALKAYYGK
ncbi:MAG: BMC domain-containing protein [Clostridia bacterium]|nr:BMC domain-containing protein [Clostridia bacterium]